HELIVVAGDVAGGVDGGQLVLTGSSLVVLCLGCYTQLPELFVKLSHVLDDIFLDVAVVVVGKLLTFLGFSAEKCASANENIPSLLCILFVNEEIFLLGAAHGHDFGAACDAQSVD